MPRVGLALAVACVSLALSLTGCSDAFNAGPLEYVENEALTKEVKGKANLAKSPMLQEKVRKALENLFGDSPQHIKVPAGSGLPAGGLYLASYVQEGEGAQAKFLRLYEDKAVDVADAGRARRVSDRRAAGRRLWPLSPQLPALPRRLGCRRRADGAVPLSAAARLSQGNLQVHLDAQRCQARTATTCAGRSRTACTAPRCRRSTRS